MSEMKIGIAQLNAIIGDFKHNADRIIYFSEKAKGLGCDLVVFSELVVPGYPPWDLLERRDFVDENRSCLERLIEDIQGIGVLVGYVEKNKTTKGKPLYNSAVLFENGRIRHQAQKRLLPTYDVFDERRYFEPGNENRAFSYKGRRIGLSICEDAWNDKDVFGKRIYAYDPVALLIKDGADLIINMAASPFHVRKREFRWEMLGSIARKHKVPLIFANQVGGNDSLIFDGLSAAFDANGSMVARAHDFAEDLVIYDLSAPQPVEASWHGISDSDIESVLKALVLGTRDYVTKCGFSKAIVGLSGGIDSALTICIAAEALGKENVAAVFMPSAYTSADNYEDTRRLAGNLGIPLQTIPIDDMVQAFLTHLTSDAALPEPDIMTQNVQARIRGTILMGLSNKTGALVLSTGNKSELAVGYCTLYGDMSGGLAVISDVPKTMVYDLARFINREDSRIPVRILEKAPSAELKPDQKDQDDLPPYEILDEILKGYIEDLKSAAELVKLGFDKALVEDVLARVQKNEYKRYQAAPGLKVTSKAFGFGRRYPIAQGFQVKLD